MKKRLFNQLNYTILLVFFMAGLSVSCGKKGPLYLPKDKLEALHDARQKEQQQGVDKDKDQHSDKKKTGVKSKTETEKPDEKAEQ